MRYVEEVKKIYLAGNTVNYFTSLLSRWGGQIKRMSVSRVGKSGNLNLEGLILEPVSSNPARVKPMI